MSAPRSSPATQAARPADGVAPRASTLRVHNAHKWFGSHHVLDGITLTVPPGKVTVIIGPSGSGKSTLLRTINHLEKLDTGYVSVNGEPIGVTRHRGRLKELGERAILKQRARIGYVFQNFHLFSNLTVLDNITAAPLATGFWDSSTARQRAVELLALVGLADRADSYPRQLSGGQQQRVAIARALALKPGVILFDEPTSALDPELVGEVLQVIEDLASTGTTLVIVTHEIGFARRVADEVVFLDEGRVVEQGPPAQVLGAPQEDRTRKFLKQVL